MHNRSVGAGEALYESPLRLEMGHGTRSLGAGALLGLLLFSRLGQKAQDCYLLPADSCSSPGGVGGACLREEKTRILPR